VQKSDKIAMKKYIFATMKMHIFTFLKGMAMGIAEIIPGVSGGTIAFITGIYERLLDAIKSVNLSLIKTLRDDGIAGFWKAIDGNFLLALFGGMVVSIILFAKLITGLMDTNKELLWAFFFGLIVASAIFIGKQIKKWNTSTGSLLLLGLAIAYYITVAVPAQGSDALWLVFLAGTIAISAMILPGISGSFILLLMGMYQIILPTVSEFIETRSMDSFVIVAVFAAGCLIGLLTFANIFSWTFKKYREQTLAILTGFMIGSLNKVWPWRNVVETRINSHGEEVPFRDLSVLPTNYIGEPMVIGVIALAIIGAIIVFALDYFSVDEK
jgi:putative membrane protein